MTQKRKRSHRTPHTAAAPLTTAELQARLTLVVSGVVGIVALAAVGALVYALFAADLGALRWWAGLATVVAVLAPFLGYFLGTSAARAHREGLQDGMETVQDLMQTGVATTMAAAADTAQIRIHTARALRRPENAKLTGDELNAAVQHAIGADPRYALPEAARPSGEYPMERGRRLVGTDGSVIHG